MRQITFIIKPTHACNAACIYCSAYKENDHADRMEIGTYQRLLESIVQYSRESFLKHVNFTWHGGEPLMVKDEFYFQAFALQEKILGSTRIEYENLMQSNLLLVSRKRLPLLSQFKNIGSSFEHLPGIRVMKKGSYNDRWFKSYEMLKEKGIEVGVIYVVHKESLKDIEGIYRFFCDFSSRYDINVKFNPMYEEGRARDHIYSRYYIQGEDWGEFLVTFYRLWESEGKRIRFEPFGIYDDFHFTGKARMECDKTGRCFDSHLGIDVDGTAYSCGRGIDNGMIPFGNIHNRSLGEIISCPERLMFRNRTIYLKMNQCRNCDWWEYCHGGCPNECIDFKGDLFHESQWCAGVKRFFETIYKKPNRHHSLTDTEIDEDLRVVSQGL